MKYVIVLTDGAADYPVASLGNRTPLEAAQTPAMNDLAKHGECGLVKTVPDSVKPGSDTANLSVMGYDPTKCYTGRSPLEAVSMGIRLADDDVAMRCNLVTLSDTERFEDAVMVDYSAGEITTEEATALISAVAAELNTENIHLYPGISYRHCLVLSHADTGTDCTPPHDISGRPIADHLPNGRYGEMILDMMKRSREILRNHPVNVSRRERGLHEATSCWFWGEGKRPSLQLFRELYGLSGTVISAVDLIKGIGLCAGFESIDVDGATGTLDTNFEGKTAAAIDALKRGRDFVYIHLEGPDECGHHADIEGKITAIERIDARVLKPVLAYLKECGEPYTVMVLPDHPTPVSTMTHARDSVPFVMYRSEGSDGTHTAEAYDERHAAETGLTVPDGPSLMRHFLGKN
ncbi:MAG: cofactor-independent phosphoglycerate mutase [Clostridiaceae bacterium]|nr:cofactor-independent phosphoglycerate mutase [Clostridiaceae bacterium]